MNEELQAYIDDQIVRMARGESEEAFFNLIDLPREAISLLQQEYKRQDNSELRAGIVAVIWEFREPATLPFLAEALDEAGENVWKEALDGIVAIGGDEAFEILRRAQNRSKSEKKRSWVEEAMEQVRDTEHD